MRRFLIYLSGASPDILELCPTERIKFESRGLTILVASVFCAVGSSSLFVESLGISDILGLAFGCLVGLALLAVNRIMASIKSVGRGRRVMVAFPGILIAMLLGVIIAQGIVLRVFRVEINAQIAVMHAVSESAFLSEESNGAVAQKISQLESQVANLDNVIASNGTATLSGVNDPTLVGLQGKLKSAEQRATSDKTLWSCQLFGGPACPNGSGVTGNGPIAQKEHQTYEADEIEINDLQGEISQRKLTVAKNELPVAQASLNATQAELQSTEESFASANAQDNGLLARLQALNQLEGVDVDVRIAAFMIYALVAIIFALPQVIVIVQPSGNYERILAAAERKEMVRVHYRTRYDAQDSLEAVLDRESRSALLPQQWASQPQALDADRENDALRRMLDMRGSSHGTFDKLDDGEFEGFS
jgi:hypothetical protein